MEKYIWLVVIVVAFYIFFKYVNYIKCNDDIINDITINECEGCPINDTSACIFCRNNKI